jgi:hypothetical protein
LVEEKGAPELRRLQGEFNSAGDCRNKISDAEFKGKVQLNKWLNTEKDNHRDTRRDPEYKNELSPDENGRYEPIEGSPEIVQP